MSARRWLVKLIAAGCPIPTRRPPAPRACSRAMRRRVYVLVSSLLASCPSAEGGVPVSKTREVRHVSVSIERSPDDVYRYASDVERWPEWAHGLGKSVRKAGDAWIAEGPLGEVKVRFAATNPFRVLDHDVTLPNGQTFHNSFRVIPNGEGS